MDTFDVKIWKTKVIERKKWTTYQVRWSVDGKECNETFKTSALADSFRSKLVTASRNGEPFDTEAGRPTAWGRTNKVQNWFPFAVSYAKFKWADASPKHRKSIAESLTNVTTALLASKKAPDAAALREACRVAFRDKPREVTMSAEISETIAWLERNTRSVGDLMKPDVLRAAIKAAESKLDGTPASTNTAKRKRQTLRNALDYAVDEELLTSNPFIEVKLAKKKKTATLREVDQRSVINHLQFRCLLKDIAQQRPSGPQLVTFFGCMYYAGLRPEEAAALNKSNLSLPPAELNPETGEWEFADGINGWGKLHIENAAPEIGAEWTDSDDANEERGLKHRDRGESRTVPCAPELTLLLHNHLATLGTGPDGRLFRGTRNGARIGSSVYGRAWDKARRAVFTDDVVNSPLGKRPYDLRHAAVSTWLTGGVEPVRAAAWAGHSVAVLYKVYAKFIDSGEQAALARVQEALRR